MTEIKLGKSPWKGLKIVALSIPLVAIGIWMIYDKPPGSSDYIMAWIFTCFFSLGIFVGLFQTFDRRPQIIINEHGIWDRTTKQGEIKWDHVKDAYPLDIHKQKFVCLVLDDSFEMKKKLNKWAAKLNEKIGAQKVNLMLSQLKITEHTMTRFIKEMVMAEKQNRSAIIREYFGN